MVKKFGDVQYVVRKGSKMEPEEIKKPDKTVAALLALFVGGIGIHKFYMGRVMMGIFYLLFCWTFVPSVAAFIEGTIYLCIDDEAFQKYCN